MRRIIYNSVYSRNIYQFIELKRKLGFKYETVPRILKQIDKFADERNEIQEGITREFARKWCELRLHETESNRYTRISILSQFSSYLIDLGIDSFIPKLPPYPLGKFIPHIFSHNEVNAMFEASDNLKSITVIPESCLMSIPPLIRLLYATGLRIGEALQLKNDDVNVEERYLRVKDSKNGQERIIPISSSLASVCQNHIDSKSRFLKKKQEAFFFTNLNGKKCSHIGVSNWFKKILRTAGIPYLGRTQGPRIHDLRHTFAVHSLANMAESGIDLYASLPILSNYLGHRSIAATNHYVRLTENMYPGLIKDIDKICLDVFPQFRNYETD
jgi:integrase